jgi:anaerobic magnesium-protoporphyrin IX monomethyl ester cyclase
MPSSESLPGGAHSEQGGPKRRIVLVNPPSPPALTANREGAGGLGAWSAGGSGFLYPPHTLATTAAALREHHWDVSIIDAAGERLEPEETVPRLRQPAAIIAVQVAHISLDSDIRFLNTLRPLIGAARLLAIGTSAALAELHLRERTDADHIVCGEPEAMLLPVAEALTSDTASHPLRRTVTAKDVAAPGIDADGRVLDLDSLPHPAWDLLPLSRYGFVTVFASRGCDDTCAFCPYVVGQGHQFRSRNPERVVDEMAWLAGTIAPKRVIMRDPVFAHDRGRVQSICYGLIARRVKLAWECESRPEHFNSDLLALMQRVGCTTIKLGFETVSEPVLRQLRRIPPDGEASEYLRQTASVVQACRSLGLACRLFVMTGLPGQSDEDVTATMQFLHAVRPTAAHVKAFHRYPGLVMPGPIPADERKRGEAQARYMEAAIAEMQPRRLPTAWRSARRWLARHVAWRPSTRRRA